MKFCISKIHLGRYKIDMLDENNQIVSGMDGGSALVMTLLTEWLFVPEHHQYMKDQRASSDALADEAIGNMKRNPSKYLSPKPKQLVPFTVKGASKS